MTTENQRRYVLYVKHACEFCDEAIDICQSEDLDYDRIYITPSNRPGKIWMWIDHTNIIREIEEEVIPSVPALWDRNLGILACGVSSMRKLIGLEVSTEGNISDGNNP